MSPQRVSPPARGVSGSAPVSTTVWAMSGSFRFAARLLRRSRSKPWSSVILCCCMRIPIAAPICRLLLAGPGWHVVENEWAQDVGIVRGITDVGATRASRFEVPSFVCVHPASRQAQRRPDPNATATASVRGAGLGRLHRYLPVSLRKNSPRADPLMATMAIWVWAEPASRSGVEASAPTHSFPGTSCRSRGPGPR